jgi:branched-chain amino acid transport system ATP-binding protein
VSASDTILEVRGLTVCYGKVRAVDDIDLVVRRGRVATMIGSNGAGKTTIMKAISGLLRPSAGSIRFDGQEIVGEPVDAIVVRGVSLVPEGRRLFPSMSVRENLIVGAYRRTDPTAVQRDLELVLGYFPMLAGRLDSPARSLSGGQQQMLAVGRALMSAPKLMMLDEPSIGLAPGAVQAIAEIITMISDSGVDILLVEQNAHMALDLADDAWVLENGRVALKGSPQELARNDQVREAYLGL